MKRKSLSKLAASALVLMSVLAVTGCSDSEETTPEKPAETATVQEAETEDSIAETIVVEGDASDDFAPVSDPELVKGLHSIHGSMLYISPEENCYWYQTRQGRVGAGDLEETEKGLGIDYNDFYYDLMYRASDGVLQPQQNGSSDEEDPYNFDSLTFQPDDANSINMWELSELDGTWVNQKGETITIDTAKMEYDASNETTGAGGTVADDHNGKGPFLSLNGWAYICMGQDHNRFMLQFQAGQYSGPDGSFTGIFYRDGSIENCTDLSNESCFFNENDALCYTDGVETFVLPREYDLQDDWAVDADGHKFGR